MLPQARQSPAVFIWPPLLERNVLRTEISLFIFSTEMCTPGILLLD